MNSSGNEPYTRFGYNSTLGVVGDVLADRTPMVFVSYSDLSFALFGIILVFIIYKTTKTDISNSIVVKISDAIELAAFTVIGDR